MSDTRNVRQVLKADGLLLLTAIIWGTAFVAQRSGMAVIGPFAFSAARFALGTLVLVPLLILGKRRAPSPPGPNAGPRLAAGARLAWAALAGLVLFTAANLQQIGMVHTTAGNSGFITCLYVILVPLAGLCVGRRPGVRIWIGCGFALTGLYCLSIGSGFTLAPGDGLELLGAFFWAGHILVINRLANRMEALEIAVGQFAVCSILSTAAALIWEPAPFRGLAPAAIPILYGGLLSIGVAFTLQIVAQKTAHPAHASIILSMEGLFAGIGGVVLLQEPLTLRLVVGGALMLTGMICSQLQPRRSRAAAGLEPEPEALAEPTRP